MNELHQPSSILYVYSTTYTNFRNLTNLVATTVEK